MPSHRKASSTEQECGVKAVAILFASQRSVSTQQLPYLPRPEFGSLALGVQSRRLLSPSMYLMSCGHCAAGRVGQRRRAPGGKEARPAREWVEEASAGKEARRHGRRCLSVAVAGSVFRAGRVAAEARRAAILVHLHKVERAVEAAHQRRDVDVEGELGILEPKHLVAVAGTVEEIGS